MDVSALATYLFARLPTYCRTSALLLTLLIRNLQAFSTPKGTGYYLANYGSADIKKDVSRRDA